MGMLIQSIIKLFHISWTGTRFEEINVFLQVLFIKDLLWLNIKHAYLSLLKSNNNKRELLKALKKQYILSYWSLKEKIYYVFIYSCIKYSPNIYYMGA